MTQPKLEKHFFSHDYGARNDERIIALMAEHGLAGYGLFWILTEKLFENGGHLEANYKLLAYDLRINTETIKTVIEKSGLFKMKAGRFYSESVLRRLAIRRAKTGKASMAATTRWDREKLADAGFKDFWKAYPKKDGHDEALAAWNAKKPPLDKCLKALEWQVKSEQWVKGLIPAPARYITAGKWKDVPLDHEEVACSVCGATGTLKKGTKGTPICKKCKEAGKPK